MKKALAVLFHPLLLLALGLLCLAILIWWVGPLVAIGRWRPLETEAERYLCIGVLLALALIWRGWLAYRRHRNNRQLIGGLAAQASAPALPSAADAELEVLRQRFQDAVKGLREAGLAAAGARPRWRDLLSLSGRQYLYQLPWYMIIGAPGSGKTTALIQSGLRFPLAERLGTASIQGVGGTRNCDWWFTDEAVLVDTAGRYTTQDSDRELDQPAWQGFLALLRKTRPRQPVNGVLLAISVQDLLTMSASQRGEAVSGLQARMRELSQAFGMRIPVYVLVTKTDLLPGFDAFFGDLSREERAQVLGFTLPLEQGAAPAEATLAARLRAELAAIGTRLAARTLTRIEAEPEPGRRGDVFGFPLQFAAFKPVLAEFVCEIFSPSRFSESALLRGVYLTSGTQEGSPIDRLRGALARAFGLDRQVLPPQRSSGRSFFITRLLRDVVFRESGLAGANLAWSRRRYWLRLGGGIGLGVVAIGLLAVWGISYVGNQRYVLAVQAQAEAARQALARTGAQPGGDLVTLLPVLASVRGLASTGTVQPDAPALSMQWGLWQGGKLDAAAQAAYQNLLRDLLLPRIAARIEEQVRGAGPSNPEYAYEALKSYLVMHQPEHQDADALKGWITADWERTLPRDVGPEQRAQLQAHLDALLAAGAIQSTLPYDPALVASVRAMLARQSLAQRVYGRIRRGGVGSDYPEFTVAKAGGPNAPLVFERSSGEPLTRGVAGLFSNDAYHNAFLKSIDRTAAQLVLEEPWVLGTRGGLPGPVAMQRLTEDVRRLYLEDYARQWEGFLADVRLIRVSSLQQAVQVARILSAPDSPLANFVRAASRETTLGTRPQAQTNVLDKASDKVREARQGVLKMLGDDDPTRIAPLTNGGRLENIVDDRFTALRALASPPEQGQPAPVGQLIAQINDAYTYLSATDAALQGKSAPPASDVPAKLASTAGRMPEPVRTVLLNLSTAGSTETQEAKRANFSADLKASLSTFCDRAVTGRYPFNRSSGIDVTLDDFGSLFAPGGKFDDFFQKNLAAEVDTSTKPWAFKRVGGAAAQASPAGLVQFERAAAIREVFFRGGGKAPSLKLEFRPLEMDPGILQFVIDIDGQIVRYAHGPQVATPVQWPGPRGGNRVSLQLTPPPSQQAAGLAYEGPWALFRMFDRVRIEPSAQPDRFLVTFDVEGRKARFEVMASSVVNPFRLADLKAFSCPASL